jgi:hypothetical protein
MNKFLIVFLLTALLGCGSKSSSKKKSSTPGLPETLALGTSTTAEVQQELGQPSNTYTIDNAEMQTFKDNKTLKFENNVAKALFRNPEKDEIFLQYWLQKWKDKKTKDEPVEEKYATHGLPSYQLICVEEQTTIIYDKETAVVKRVIYYEK